MKIEINRSYAWDMINLILDKQKGMVELSDTDAEYVEHLDELKNYLWDKIEEAEVPIAMQDYTPKETSINIKKVLDYDNEPSW